MAAGTPSIDPRRRGVLELAAGVACLLAVTAGLQLLAGVTPNPLSRAALGALGLSFVASAVKLPTEAWGVAARARALRGAAVGALVAILSLVVALATGSALRRGEPGLGLALGLAEAVAGAYRDELWLRGLPLHFARRAGVPVAPTAAYLACTGLACALGTPHVTPAGAALTVGLGVLASASWLRTGDSWAPVAAIATWRMLADVLLAGDGLDLVPHKLPSGPTSGGAIAWATALVAGGLAVAVWLRTPQAPPSEVAARRSP